MTAIFGTGVLKYSEGPLLNSLQLKPIEENHHAERGIRKCRSVSQAVKTRTQGSILLPYQRIVVRTHQFCAILRSLWTTEVHSPSRSREVAAGQAYFLESE